MVKQNLGSMQGGIEEISRNLRRAIDKGIQ